MKHEPRWTITLTWFGRLIWNCPVPLPGIRLLPADWLGRMEPVETKVSSAAVREPSTEGEA